MTRPQSYENFFSMLNSAEHEISPANKQQNTDTVVFMLSLAECAIFCAYKYENANISWHFHLYQQKKKIMLI